MGLKIIGTGRKLPGRIVSNDELANLIETDDEWITSKTGIKSRRVCTNESINDLAAEAGNIAIKRSGLKPSEIDLVIGTTVSGDYVTPTLSCDILQKIGANCPAFDINAACSGFIYALDIAKAYINSGSAKNILIVSAEMMSRMINWTDRNTCILFGDGAGACVVTKSPGNTVKYTKLTADGTTEPLYQRAGTGNSPFVSKKLEHGFVQMQGQDVFKFAVKTIGDEIQEALEKLDIAAESVDYFILHQANKRIIDGISKRLKQPTEKFPINIDKYGNMSSASIPVLLDEMICDNKIKPGDTLVFAGFGAGLTTGTCVIVWE